MPDRDFVVRWSEVETVETRSAAWSIWDEQNSYVLLRIRAPKSLQSEDSYPQAFYMLIDRSGSMEGLKWTKAMEALRGFLSQLSQQDQAFLTFFSDTAQDFAEKLLSPAKILEDGALQSIEQSGTQGGTELLPALEHALEKLAKQKNELPATLVLITDGEIGNEAAVLKRLSAHPNLRVHVFGIDTTINDGFLTKLAAQNHGSSCLLSPKDDIVGAVVRLAATLRRPVLTDLKLPSGWSMAGHLSPQLHSGETLSLALKGPSSAAPAELKLKGQRTDGSRLEMKVTVASTLSPAPRLLWAKREIESLLARNRNDNAIALAKQHNLICEGAAFVAWDEAEKVAIAGPDMVAYQPSFAMHRVCASPPAPPPHFLARRVCADSLLEDVDLSEEPGLLVSRPLKTDRRRRFKLIVDEIGLSYSTAKAIEFDRLLGRAPGDEIDELLDRLESIARRIVVLAREVDQAQRLLQQTTATMESLASDQAKEFLATKRLDTHRALNIRELVEALLKAGEERDRLREELRRLRREFQEVLDAFASAHGVRRIELVSEVAD